MLTSPGLPRVDLCFYNTTAEEKAASMTNPLYTGAMASVPSICEVIEDSLNLKVEGDRTQAG